MHAEVSKWMSRVMLALRGQDEPPHRLIHLQQTMIGILRTCCGGDAALIDIPCALLWCPVRGQGYIW
jgi:hypothetical protein